MDFPEIDVDEETFDLIKDYVLSVKEYYKKCLAEKEKEAADLQEKLRGIEVYCTAYKNRISGFDVFLDGLNIQPLPFSEDK